MKHLLLLLPAYFLLSFYFADAQVYQTYYHVRQTVDHSLKLDIEYEGIATISRSSYLYLQKTKESFRKDEIRKTAEDGSMIIYRPNPDSIPKIIYRSFDSSFIRWRISNSHDDIQYYLQEQPGNKIQTVLLNESRNIRGFLCRKALFYHPSNSKEPVAVAWYCPDIQIYAGPADLSGLPGLIVEAEHFQTREQFTLIRYKEVEETGSFSYWPVEFNGVLFVRLTKLPAGNKE